MDSIYPDALDGYSQLPLIIDGTTAIDASSINAMRSAIVAIEAELGISPKGEYSNVGSRITALEASGDLSSEVDALEVAVAALLEASGDLSSEVDALEAAVAALLEASGDLSSEVDALEAAVAALEAAALSVTSPASEELVKFLDATGTAITGSGITVNASGEVRIPGDVLMSAGKTLIVGNRRHYGSANTAPTSPLPVHGDSYFDTGISQEMYWDANRSSWLSVQTFELDFGRNGSVPKGGFFRTTDSKAMSATLGEYALNNGMITQITLTRDAPITTPWEVYYTVVRNGTTIAAELQLSGAVTSGLTGLSGVFNAGEVISVKVNSTSPNDSTPGTIGKVYYKWRK
jgi:hypothetical protein